MEIPEVKQAPKEPEPPKPQPAVPKQKARSFY